MAGSPLKVALVGAGQRGRSHLQVLRMLGGQVIVTAVADVDPAQLEKAAQVTGPGPRFTRDYRDIVRASHVEAVIVATPNYLHREHAVAALTAGKHVLCEKPLATSEADAVAIQSAAETAKRILLPGHELRFAPAYLQLRESLSRIGNVRQLLHEELRGDWYAQSWRYQGRQNWRHSQAASGGTLLEKSLHFADLFQMILKQRPTGGNCRGGIAHYRDGRDTWDHLTLTLEYPGGVQATHTLSMFHRPSETKLRVLGESGVLTVTDHRRLSYYGYGQEPVTLFDSEGAEGAAAALHSGDLQMHQAFLAAIREGGATLPFDPSIGVEAVGICERALRTERAGIDR